MLVFLAKRRLYDEDKAEIDQFVALFKKANKVIDSCIGRELRIGWNQAILDLKIMWTMLGWKETRKVHIIFNHIPQCLSSRIEGLAICSEDCTESCHSDCNKLYQEFKRYPEAKEYGEKLLAATSN